MICLSAMKDKHLPDERKKIAINACNLIYLDLIFALESLSLEEVSYAIRRFLDRVNFRLDQMAFLKSHHEVLFKEQFERANIILQRMGKSFPQR